MARSLCASPASSTWRPRRVCGRPVADLAAGPSAHLTIDLTDLAFADLAGLRALDAIRHDVAKAGADFRLVGVNEYLLHIIQVAGFADLDRACAATHQRLGR